MVRRSEQDEMDKRRGRLASGEGFWRNVPGRYRPVHDIGVDRQEWQMTRRETDAFGLRLRRGIFS